VAGVGQQSAPSSVWFALGWLWLAALYALVGRRRRHSMGATGFGGGRREGKGLRNQPAAHLHRQRRLCPSSTESGSNSNSNSDPN